ncbi:Succinyl-diaminopimelate desuccinylase [archaeon HR01]|nr:Succinyl-diaminopimelate desuccinylase [archaeon HR01]
MDAEAKKSIIDSVQRDELVSLCSKLIQLGGENPPGDTTEIAGYIAELLEMSGFSVKRYEPKKNMVNLVSSIGSGNPSLILCGHLDVFPAGPNWSFDPFSGMAVDGKIFGRGAVDMKAGVAASITAFETLSKYESRIQGRLTLALYSDEESMGFGGAQWMLNNVNEVRGDACLIGEPAGPDIITLAEKGVLWLRFVAEGELAHGAYSGGDNAILKISRLIEALERLKEISGKAPPELKEYMHEQLSFYDKYGLSRMASALNKVWLNCGVIRGGEKVNMVPQRCELEVDIRLPLGISPAYMLERIRETIQWIGSIGIKQEIMFFIEPNYTHPNEKIVEITRNNVAELVGAKPKLFTRLGSTDGKFYRLAGIPTVTYGPDAKTMGTVDEYVRIDELIYTALVHLGVACDFLNLG